MTQLYNTKASAVIQTLLQSARNVGHKTALVFALFLFASSGLWAQNVSVLSTGTPGADADYSTVSAAFTAINAGTHQGRITIAINGDVTEPNTPTALVDSGVGASRYSSVIMYPTADAVTITTTSSFANNRGIIELNGADNVTIDGDNPNSIGINRNLRIAMGSVAATNLQACIRLMSGTSTVNDAANIALAVRNVAIRNLNISGVYGSTSSNGTIGIYTGSNTATFTSLFTTSTFVSDISITNCDFKTMKRAIHLYSSTTAGARFNNIYVANNNVGTSSSTAATLGSNVGNQSPQEGFYLYYCDNLLVANNTLDLITNVTGTQYGIYTGGGTGTSALNIVIRGNNIRRFWANVTGTTATSIQGLLFFGDNLRILDNKISNMRGIATLASTTTGVMMTTSAVFGLYQTSGTAGTTVYGNTVNMYGAPMNTSTTLCYSGAAMYSSSFANGSDIRNNIFINKMSHNSGATGATVGRFASFFLSSGTTNPTNTTINNNYYGITQSTSQHFVQVAGLGSSATTRDLAAFTTNSRTWTGANASNNGSSATGAPLTFTADDNLTFASVPAAIENLGADLSANVLGFTIDARGITRSSTPDLGAEEYPGSADATAPTFTGTTLADHTGGPDRTITVTISDAASKASAYGPTRARFYYRKVGGAVWFSALGTNTAGNTWAFTLNYASLGGVVVGDQIEYFFAAADLQGNIGFSPSISFESRPTSTMISDADGISPSGLFDIISEPKSVGADPIATQVLTGGVGRLSTNNAVLRLQFLTNGNSGNLFLETINVATPAGVNASNISAVKLFAGTSTNFALATQIGITRTISSGTASFTSLNYDMPQGTSYVWVTADVASNATPFGTPIDLEISAGGIVIDGTPYSPSSPSGAGELAVVFNFESGYPAGFTNGQNTAGSWQVGTMPTANQTGATAPAPTGIRAGGTGTGVLGTNFGTAYSSSASYWITTPNLTVGASGTVNLNFWRWVAMENNWEDVWLDYSTDNGVTWSNNPAVHTQSSAAPPINNSLAIFTGTGATWINQTFTRTQTPGSTVQFRFWFKSDGSGNYNGFYIDDMIITGIVVDEVAPVVTTATVANTTATGDRTLTAVANITDNVSINTSTGTKPRIYYKKSTQSNDSANWKFTETISNTGDDFDFTILRSSFDTLIVGETIQYFVVAQDNGLVNNFAAPANVNFASAPTSVRLRAANFPVSGSGIKSYGIIAGPRVFAGVTVDQPSASIQSTNPGVTNTALVRVKIDVNGTLGNIYLTKLVANLTGNIAPAQITRPRINTTGSRPTFTTPAIFGSVAQNFSGGTVTFNAANSGSGWPITLNPGANYIWLTVNVESNGSPGAIIDATISEISVSKSTTLDSNRLGSTQNPVGNLVVLNTMTFESGDQGFANASSNTSFWTRTTMPAAGTVPNTINAGFALASDPFPGYRAGNIGTQVWGTNAFNTPVGGVTLGNQDLLSPIFVAQGTSVNFSFWNWWSLDDPTFAFDEVIFQYTIDGGATWVSASTNANGPNRNTPTAGWKQRTITVPTTAGQTVQLRFRYEGDATDILAGYYFDDFQVDAPFLVDATAPTIALGTVDNTPSRANRTLTGLATVADPNPGFGVNTSTTLRPRLFYKRSTDANNSSGWKSVAANNTTSPYSFTIDYTLLNGGTGVSVGNVIQYFVVAQDNAPVPNVGVTPGVTLSGAKTSVNLSPANLLLVSGTPSYEIVNGPLTLDSVLVTHPTATAVRGSNNQVLSMIELQVGGSLNSLNLTALTVNSNSVNMTTTNVGNVRLFYTNNTTFSTANPVGSAVTLTGTGTTATMVFTGLSRALSAGSNYIWVTADIPVGATINTALDVQQAINSVSVSDGTTTSTLPRVAKSPTGTVNVTLPVLPNLAYTVTRSTGIEYSSIVGLDGTSTFGFAAFASRDDAVSPAVDISSVFGGFLFQGETITSIAASTNGNLQFNPDFSPTTSYTNTSAIRKAIVPMNDDLYCSTTDPNNHHFWRVDGTPGNRVLTAEWVSMEQFTHAGPDLNFQVKLYEADDRIEIIYGTMVGFNGSVNKAYDYTMGIFGGVTGTSQLTATPLAGQYLSQRFENTNNFQNNTLTATLASVPACNSRVTFTPSGSFTNGTSTAPTISNTFCGAARPISLTFGAQIDNCNVYRSALYAGTAPTPAVCTTGVASGEDDAAWFSFYNDSPRDIVVLVNASGGYAPAIQLASNCSTALACTTTTTAGGIMQLNYTGLGVGTFYVRVHHNGTGTSGTPTSGGLGTGNFTMSVYTTASAPANDTCGGALTLTPNAAETLGSTLNATSQANSPAGVGSGADPDDDDVWYKFTATTTSATILSRGVSPFIPVVEVWRTSCPNNLTATTERLLQSNPNLATQQSNLLTGLTVGTTYYIRVYHRATGAPASGSRQFYLQVSLPRPSCPVVNTTPAALDRIATPANAAIGISYDSSTVFAWNRVTFDGTISYRYYFGTNATPTDGMFTTTSDSSYITPVLSGGVTYYFQVRTVSSSNGESINCLTRSFTTKVAPGVPVCPTLTAPLANAVTSTTPTITWGAVADAFRYSVVIATDAGFTSIAYSNTNVSGGLTSLAIPSGSLVGNTNYFVRVTPRNTANVTPALACNAVSFNTEVANNNAAGAVALTFGTSCSPVSATSIGASASTVTNGVGVAGANTDDVWFSFVPTTQNVTISVTGGTTPGTLQNPVIELALSNGTTFATFDGNTGATEIGSANVPFVDGRNYLVRVYSRSTNVNTAGTFNICVIGAATLTGNNTISGDYGSVTVTTGNTLTINGATTVGNLTVESGGTLIVQGSNVVSGNIFTLAAGATLQIASPAGISSGTSATGNIQFAVRNFSNDANYVYNGSAAQATGTGLPTRVRNLTINNSNGVTLTSNTSVAEVLNIIAGTFACGSNNFTFLSSPTVTARLSQIVPGTSAITGTNFTVERNAGVYNASPNTATGGYYFLGTPVTGATLSNWSVSGRFNQVFTGLTRSTYTYDATTGWSSGTAATAMEPGNGAQIWADQSLQRNNIPFAINGNGITTGNVDITGTAANATTFRMVANPYPSAINFGSVQAASTNIDNTFWVWSHAIRNYLAVTNGNGTVPVSSGGLDNDLASSQGFFVKATAAGAYSVNFRETHKTSESNVAIGRNAVNGVVRMNVVAGNVTSFAAVFLNNQASTSFDRQFDGQLLPSAVNISTVTNTNERLSINSIPVPTVNETVGINISSNVAGVHTITFSDLSDLPTGMRVFLQDRTNGTLTEISAGFTFQVTLEANANTDRYSLVFTPASVNNAANKLGQELVSVFPNPATSGNFTVRTSGFSTEKATIIVTDAVGKTVHTQTIEVGLTPVNNTVNTKISAGVYNVTCISGNSRITTKLVVNK